MQPILAFDPAANPSGFITTNGINKNEQLVLYNSSLSCLQLTFNDKTTDVLPPCWARDWIKPSPMGKIAYSTLFTLPITGQPISQLYGTLYENGEHSASLNQPLQYVQIASNTLTAMLLQLFTNNSVATVFESGRSTSELWTTMIAEGVLSLGSNILTDTNNPAIQLNQTNPFTTSAQGVGSSGSMIMFMPFGAHIDASIPPLNPLTFLLIGFNNWTNKTAFNSSWGFESQGFKKGCFYLNFDGGPFSFVHNNAVTNGTIWSSFGTAQFNTTTQPQMNPNSAGYLNSPFEAIQLLIGTTSHNGFILLVGW